MVWSGIKIVPHYAPLCSSEDIKIPPYTESLCWQVIGWCNKSSKYWNLNHLPLGYFIFQRKTYTSKEFKCLKRLVFHLYMYWLKNSCKQLIIEFVLQINIPSDNVPRVLNWNVSILELLSFMCSENDIETTVIKFIFLSNNNKVDIVTATQYFWA